MKILIAILMMLPALSFAAPHARPPAKPRPAVAQNSNEFAVVVNMGQKRHWYKVWQAPGGKFYSASTGGKPTVGVLSEQHFYYLNMQSRQVASMPATPTNSCPKSNMMLIKDNKVLRSVCIGAKNQTTAKMTELASLLAMLQ